LKKEVVQPPHCFEVENRYSFGYHVRRAPTLQLGKVVSMLCHDTCHP